MKTFTLSIETSENPLLYESITKLLKVQPEPFSSFFQDDVETFSSWNYVVKQKNGEESINGLDQIMDVIEPNLASLSSLRIQKSDISLSFHHSFGSGDFDDVDYNYEEGENEE